MSSVNSERNEMRPRLSVVAPCFNEEEGLPEFCRLVEEACITTVGTSFEIVLINDGSRDGTWNVMSNIAANKSRVVAINLSRNYGHQIALTAGLHACRGERILIIDADLQDPPELLEQMMALMDEGAEIVYGQRRKREGETLIKSWTAAIFYRLLRKLVDIDIPLDTGDFRLMSRRALDVLNSMPEQSRFIRGMVSWIGLKQVPLLYDRQARFAGSTNYPFSKMLRLAFDAITGFSIMPLRLASYLGVAMGCASMAMIGYSLLSWAMGSAVAGWTSMMTMMLLIGSTQFLVLGMFGEYLGRMYMETKRRPLYVVDSVAGNIAVAPAMSAPQHRLMAS